jgi:nucleoside 2-deoxyribosyltransferase
MPEGPKTKPFTVYLAGPMSAYKDDPQDPYGFQRFHRAARRLRELGIVVMSPAETAGQVRIMPRSWYFRYDFAVISNCDAVVVLPGWVTSGGAKSEVIYATEVGVPIYKYDDRDGLGRRVRGYGWVISFETEPNDGAWRDLVQHDTHIAPPVEAFPEGTV